MACELPDLDDDQYEPAGAFVIGLYVAISVLAIVCALLPALYS